MYVEATAAAHRAAARFLKYAGVSSFCLAAMDRLILPCSPTHPAGGYGGVDHG
jgi:hypothetical protein